MRPDAKVQKVYLYPKPVDFRKSINGLAALVELDIKVEVFNPVLFVFLIRPFVIGRKNWLFSDTPKGATASAQIYSLIETAKANGQEPYAWLRHILERLPGAQSVEEYEALLPWNCSPASATAS